MDFDLSDLNANYVPTPPARPLAAASRRLRQGQTAKPKRQVKVNPKTVEAGKAALERSRPVTIQLSQRFIINSAPQSKVHTRPDGKLVYSDVPGTGGVKTYGPGSVTVPKAVAQVLLEMQRNAEQVAAAEHQERAVIIQGGPGGVKRTFDVPPDSFDQFMGSAQALSSLR